MRNGHLYKIQGMLKMGMSHDEIVHRFRGTYPAEHVREFLPRERKVVRKKRAPKTDAVPEAVADE